MTVKVKITNLTASGVGFDGYNIAPFQVSTFSFTEADFNTIKPTLDNKASQGVLSYGTKSDVPLVTQKDSTTVVPVTRATRFSGEVEVVPEGDGQTAGVRIPGIETPVVSGPTAPQQILISRADLKAEWKERAFPEKYTPSEPSDWPDPPPTTKNQALDVLAGEPSGAYTPDVPTNWAPPVPTTAAEALDALAAIPFPGRVELSVNKSQIENYQGVIPSLRTQTGPNLTGAYEGGGTGNKAILGFRGFTGLPLGSFTGLDFTWEDLIPETTLLLTAPVVWDPPAGPPTVGSSAIGLLPFINLIVDMNGDGSLIKIFNMSQTLPPTSDTNFTVTSLGTDRWNYAFDPAVNTFEIVLGLPPVPVVDPVIDDGPSWFDKAYLMADVLAAYPDATLIDIASGDGGMPKDVVTPGIVLAMGGSSNVDAALKIVEQITINGERQ